jgi:hypothetical protein
MMFNLRQVPDICPSLDTDSVSDRRGPRIYQSPEAAQAGKDSGVLDGEFISLKASKPIMRKRHKRARIECPFKSNGRLGRTKRSAKRILEEHIL